MIVRYLGCLLLAGLILVPAAGMAQIETYIGPHLGIQKAQDAEEANYLVGATVRVKLMPLLGAEGAIAYRQQDYFNDTITVRSWPVTVTGLFYPLPVVYGGLGAGWYNTTYDFEDDLGFGDETANEFGWHLAVGAELPASPNIKLTGDIRYVFLDYDLEELPDAVRNDVDADFYSITIGLLFGL